MAGSFSNYTEAGVLNYIFRGTAFTIPDPCYVALYTVAPSDTGGGTEVANANGYTRKSIDMTSGVFGAATPGDPTTISNTSVIDFASASGGNWGTVVAFGILDSGTYGSGNLIVWADLTLSKAINDGDTASFGVGQMVITLS